MQTQSGDEVVEIGWEKIKHGDYVYCDCGDGILAAGPYIVRSKANRLIQAFDCPIAFKHEGLIYQIKRRKHE